MPDSDTASQPPTAEAKPAPKAKPPAPEDKPFGSFVPELLLPALAKDIQGYGGAEPQLEFSQGAMPVVGSSCWMVKGSLPGERRFWLCFTAEDISSAKTIAVAEAGAEPSLLESFLIDEKKITLALLVSRLVQRLNATVNVNITYAKLLKELLPMPRDPILPIQPQLQLQLSSSPTTQP